MPTENRVGSGEEYTMAVMVLPTTWRQDTCNDVLTCILKSIRTDGTKFEISGNISF